MTALALQLFESPGGALIRDFSDVETCVSSVSETGYHNLDMFVAMPLRESFYYHDQAPGKYLSLNYGAGSVWEGRVEDRAIVTGGLRLTAFGAWRALTDVPYTALWGVTGTDGWFTLSSEQLSNASPEKYELDNNKRVYIAPRKNETFQNSPNKTGTLGFQVPHNSSRNIVGIQFDYEMAGASPWQARLRSADADWGSGADLWTLNATGSTQNGSIHLSFSAVASLNFALFLNSGTPTTFSGETGDCYLKITNIRMVTSITNRVNTTTSTTISAGSQMVTPASMANIYVGQRLFIAQGSTPSESVIVTAATSTTFTATFVNGYSGTTTIHAHVIYADEIIKDLVSHVTAVNPDQLNSSTVLIESPGLDLLDEVYEDQYPADIALKLVKLGDNESPPRRWEVGVYDNQMLHFRPRSSAAQEWFIDADDLEVDSTMETLINSAYGVYKDANGRTLRTAVEDDADSQAQYGIVRRTAVSADTTSATQAGVHRDTVIADGKVIKPRSVVLPDYVMDAAGAIYPKWITKAGDTLIIRNLPPVLSADIDRIRSFRIAEVKFDWISGSIEVVPEEQPVTLDFLVARSNEGF